MRNILQNVSLSLSYENEYVRFDEKPDFADAPIRKFVDVDGENEIENDVHLSRSTSKMMLKKNYINTSTLLICC